MGVGEGFHMTRARHPSFTPCGWRISNRVKDGGYDLITGSILVTPAHCLDGWYLIAGVLGDEEVGVGDPLWGPLPDAARILGLSVSHMLQRSQFPQCNGIERHLGVNNWELPIEHFHISRHFKEK